MPHSVETGSALEAALRIVLAACREAAAIRPPILRDDIFDTLLDAEIDIRMTAQDRQRLGRVNDIGARALRAARKGELAAAETLFGHARNALRDCAAGSDAHLLASSLLASRRAYLRSREGRPARARALLRSAFRIDLALEQRGYSILRMHRLQLLGNLARLQAKQRHWQAAVLLEARRLGFLETGDGTLLSGLRPPWCEGWRTGVPAVPADLTRIMHAQAGHMLLEGFRRLDAREGMAVLRRIAAVLPASQIRSWTEFEAARRTSGLIVIATSAQPIVSRGPHPSAPLWEAAVSGVRNALESPALVTGGVPSWPS